MKYQPEIEEVTVVVIGTFTSGIMSPHWLAFHGLISSQEAEEANIIFTHPDLSHFDLGWGKFLADPQRIQISTTQSPWIRASDFILKLLTEAIPGQPTRALGINVAAHYSLSHKEREAFGHRLAPREAWGNWGKYLDNADPRDSSNGLISITMRQGSDLPHKYNKYIDARIQASDSIKPSGIQIHINDHYAFQDEPEASLSSDVSAKLLNEQFDLSLRRSHSIIDDIISGIKS